MHTPPQARLVILLTCTKCNGEGSYDDPDEGICNCPRCEDGWEAASVPIGTLLNIHRPTAVAADCYTELAQVLATQKPTGHSILRHLADDLSPKAFENMRRAGSTLLKPAPVAPNNVEE